MLPSRPLVGLPIALPLLAAIHTALPGCLGVADEPSPPDAERCEVTGCDRMPRVACADARTRRTYTTPEGRCVDGACIYDQHDETCDCRDTACVDLPAIGEQRAAVILVDTVGDGSTQSPSVIQEAIFTAEYSVARFIEEASYGRASLTGDVYGWYPLDADADVCTMTDADLLGLAAGDVQFHEIDRFAILLHAPDVLCDGLGTSSHGKVPIETPEGVVEASLARAEISFRLARPTLPHTQLAAIAATVVGHELGHSLGITGHANLLDCGATAVSSDVEECSQEAIADMFSLMSGEGFFRGGLHFGACHKRDLGWLADHEIVTIDASTLEPSGALEVQLQPYERPSQEGPLALRILLPTSIEVPSASPLVQVHISELFVERRTATGFDAWLYELTQNPSRVYPGLTRLDGATPPAIDIEGVQVRGGFYKDDHCVTTYLIDPHPGSLGYQGDAYSLYDHLDAFLTLGESIYEPYNGFTVSTVEIQPDGGATVEIRAEATTAGRP